MSNSLPKLDDIREVLLTNSRQAARRARAIVRLRGVVWFVAGTLSVILLLAISDSIFQREELGLRWLYFTIGILAVIYFARQFLIPILRFEPTPRDIAQWIERRHPTRARRLAVAVELAEISPDDQRFGSSVFREAALTDWARMAEQPDWNHVISWTPMRRASLVLGFASGLLFLFAVLWPDHSQRAFQRLLLPWSNVNWPQKDLLRISNLPKVASQGMALQLEIVDSRPPLPKNVQVEMRLADAKNSTTSISAQHIDGIAVASLPPLYQDTEVRAIGGDDRSMPWQRISVIALPRWKSHHFEVMPPEYIRQSSQSRSDSPSADTQPDQDDGLKLLTGQHIEILSGSKVRFFGELDRPVESVILLPHSGRRNGTESLTDIPWSARTDSTQTNVTLGNASGDSVELAHSIEWRFGYRMDDESILESPLVWKIDMIADRVPELSMEVPRLSSIAAGANLPLRGSARDDWGLRDLTAKLTFESLPDVVLERTIAITPNSREFEVLEHWDYVSDLKAKGLLLASREKMTVWLEAHDYLGQLGRSQTEQWSLETPDRQLELISRRQAALAQQMQDLLRLQTTSQQLAQQALPQMTDGPLDQSLEDAVLGIVHLQESIRQQLNESASSVQQKIEQTQNLLELNQLSDTELNEHLNRLLQQLKESTGQQVQEAWKKSVELHSSMQSARAGPSIPSDLANAAAEFQRAQAESMRALREFADQLDSHEGLNRLRQDLMNISSHQQSLAERTHQMMLDQIRDRSDEFDRHLADLSSQQTELARQLDDWLLNIQQLDNRPNTESSTLQDQLSNASHLMSQSQSSPAMRAASRSIQSAQLGQANQVQQEIIKSLQQASELLGAVSSTQHISPLESEIATQDEELIRFKQSLEESIDDLNDIISLLEELAERLQGEDSQEAIPQEIRTIVQRQESVLEAVRHTQHQVDQMPLFQWVLNQVAHDLTKSIAATRRKRLDPDAILSAQDALGKLLAAADALREDSSTEGESDDIEQRPDSDASVIQDPPDDKAPLAGFKLIRAMQWELNQQTAALDQIADPAQRNTRRSELTQLQNQIAERLKLLLDHLQTVDQPDPSATNNSREEVQQ